MFTLKDFKVELKNPEEVKEFVKRHGEFAAVCYNTPKEKATGKYPSAIGILFFIPFIISFIFKSFLRKSLHSYARFSYY